MKKASWFKRTFGFRINIGPAHYAYQDARRINETEIFNATHPVFVLLKNTLETERNQWKSMAEELAEALEKMCIIDDLTLGLAPRIDKSKEALAKFYKLKGE